MSNKDSSPQEENFNPEQAKSFRDNYVVSEKAKGREIKKKPTGHGKDLIKGYVIPKNDILNLFQISVKVCSLILPELLIRSRD